MTADEQLLSRLFYETHRYNLDLDAPKTFSEKMQVWKLHERNPAMPVLADKILVKNHVNRLLGSEWVIPTLWSGTVLPPRAERCWQPPYVIKANHGCGWNCFVSEDPEQQWDRIETLVELWMLRVYGQHLGEWLYSAIRPQILVEPFVSDHSQTFLTDYKVLVVNGEAKFVDVITNRDKGGYSSLYTRDWEYLGVKWGIHTPEPPAVALRPDSLSQMLAAAELLVGDISLVRVDFYETDGRPLFGEMTFYPGSGLCKFDPLSFDSCLGALWTLPKY